MVAKSEAELTDHNKAMWLFAKEHKCIRLVATKIFERISVANMRLQ